jgi:hypothetical protein
MRNTTTSDSNSNKKKYGKNLNKLIKPIVPPPPTSGATSKNGLLLLSVKKSGGGMLSKQQPQQPAAAATQQSSGKKPVFDRHAASAHEVLLSAVRGKLATASADAPDAWGVSNNNTNNAPNTTYNNSSATAASNVVVPDNTTTGVIDATVVDDEQQQHQQHLAESKKEVVDHADDTGSRRDAAEKEDVQRTLMSQLALKAKQRQAETPTKTRTTPKTVKLSSWDHTRSGTRTLWEPEQKEQDTSAMVPVERLARQQDSPMANKNNNNSQQQQQYTGPVISLNNYEDRSRGERGAAPRMLFDPKSGSMVALKKEEPLRANNKPKKIVGIKKRDTTPPPSVACKPQPTQPRIANIVKPKSAPAKTTTNSSNVNPNRKLPRTCGVLYVRDGKGNLHCADDCNGGDLGYGAHSVPGGRTRNPEAYKEYLSKQQDQQPYSMYDHANNSNYYSADEAEDDEELLFQSPEPLEYIRADDKLELVTGEDDSPTLKPTAKAWAPSATALAALGTDMDSDDDTAEDLEEEDEDEDGPLALGFDPMRDMDFMHSPSHGSRDTSRLESVAMSTLALEPTLYSSGNGAHSSAATARNLFAFGASDTWSSSHNEAPLSTTNHWGVTTVEDDVGLFGAGTFRLPDGATKESSTAFLNMPGSNSSWGSPTPSIGGIDTSGDGPSSTSKGG